jgi:hypothetical protein
VTTWQYVLTLILALVASPSIFEVVKTIWNEEVKSTNDAAFTDQREVIARVQRFSELLHHMTEIGSSYDQKSTFQLVRKKERYETGSLHSNDQEDGRLPFYLAIFHNPQRIYSAFPTFSA